MNYLATVALVLFSIIGNSQQSNILIFGKIQKGEVLTKKEKRKKVNNPVPLKDVTITIKDDSEILETFNSEERSMYELYLAANMSYQIEFSKENYIPKVIQVNTNHMTDEFISKGYELITDITLFESNGAPELIAYSKLPVAICNFNRKRGTLEWDMNYAQNAYRTFVDIVEHTEADRLYKEIEFIPENEIDYEEELKMIEVLENMIQSGTFEVINTSNNRDFNKISQLEKEIEPSASAE